MPQIESAKKLEEKSSRLIIKTQFTFEECEVVAKKFKTRTDWLRGSSKTFTQAKANDWLDACCGHMKQKPPATRTIWKKGDLLTFQESTGKTKVSRPKKAKPELSLTNCLAVAKTFSNRSEWENKCGGTFQYAKKNNLLDECCKHMAGRLPPLTLEHCQRSAKRFTTKKEWKLLDSPAYTKAQKKHWLNDCCKHMVRAGLRTPPTLEECNFLAKQFSPKTEWAKAFNFEYKFALSKGWSSECCKHMERPKRAVTKRTLPTPKSKVTSELSIA